MPSQVTDKDSEPIREGDHVYTRIRGGRREGTVEQIVTTEKEAQAAGVKHPPKVSTAAISLVAADISARRLYSRTSMGTRWPTIRGLWKTLGIEQPDMCGCHRTKRVRS